MHEHGLGPEIPSHWPVFGICGYSGSGKTTLIERLIPTLVRDGLAVAVIKHDAHSLDIDRPGKDTDRLFQAGASIFAHDSFQGLLRFPSQGKLGLYEAAKWLLREHDLVLVEGHKDTSLPLKVWLRSPDEDRPPPASQAFHADLDPYDDRVGVARELIMSSLSRCLWSAPLRAGILIGGRSSRMGCPKHLVLLDGRTWLEHQVAAVSPAIETICLLGDGDVPAHLSHLARLPDAPGMGGPVAGMLSAMRWDPEADWLFLACDMPYVSAETIRWLLGQRQPGKWAVFPYDSQARVCQPLLAWYGRRLRHLLEKTDRPMALAGHPKVLRATIPAELLPAFVNLNTPEVPPS